MIITPSGNIRLALAGPFRLVDSHSLGWTKIDAHHFQSAIKEVAENSSLFTIRSREDDRVAVSIYDLIGTSNSPYPIGLIAAIDMSKTFILQSICATLSQIIEKTPAFTHFQIPTNVLRIFENGCASVILVIEFIASPIVSQDEYLQSLGELFSTDSACLNLLKSAAMKSLNRDIKNISCAIAHSRAGKRIKLDGQIEFFSTFYGITACWTEVNSPIYLNDNLRLILQPEPNEHLINQSTDNRELVIFTSGFHIFISNSYYESKKIDRFVSLVSFLVIMNVLFIEMIHIKGNIIRLLNKKSIPRNLPDDLNERLEILYNEVMVSSVSWRRDFSSFRDQVNKRWRISDSKTYCSYLISVLDAKSQRKRTKLLSILITLISLAQIISIISDGLQILERVQK